MNKNSLPKHWQKYKFEDVLQYEQPTKYLVKSTKYSDEYTTPVLTAGKSFILGYTNETDGIFQDTPVIIFDDFTTATKFVNFKFKVKSSAMKILRPTQSADIKFLFYLMQIIQIRAETHKRYWISDYSKREIYLPSVAEQREIVGEIERRFEKLDKAIENFRQILKNLKLYRQSVLKFAFDGKFTNPNLTNWQTKTLGEIFLIERGGSPRPIKEFLTNDKNGINWIKIGDTKENSKYIYQTAEKIIPEGLKHSRLVEVGDLILSNSMSFGRPYIMKTTGCIHDGWAALRNQKKIIDENFAYYVLISKQVYIQFQKLATGSTVKNLNIDRIKSVSIPLPPLSEQKQIVSEIEKRFAKADKIENLINKSLKHAEIFKQCILKQAFSGNLKVKK
ncbi:MAG: restriction endonuclease subunit S [Campylobacter sp.]|nr:restriction endonuclease subunit S [Campylobacter sp.]